jgi:hypothetical protein
VVLVSIVLCTSNRLYCDVLAITKLYTAATHACFTTTHRPLLEPHMRLLAALYAVVIAGEFELTAALFWQLVLAALTEANHRQRAVQKCVLLCLPALKLVPDDYVEFFKRNGLHAPSSLRLAIKKAQKRARAKKRGRKKAGSGRASAGGGGSSGGEDSDDLTVVSKLSRGSKSRTGSKGGSRWSEGSGGSSSVFSGSEGSGSDVISLSSSQGTTMTTGTMHLAPTTGGRGAAAGPLMAMIRKHAPS